MASRDPLTTGGSDPLGGDFMKSLNAASGSPRSRSTSTLDQYRPAVDVGSVAGSSTQPLFSNQPSSGAPVAYQPVTGNSLDQMLRSVMNLLAGQGYSTFGAGSNILSSGLNTTQSGLNLQSMPLEFWQAVLSGDPSASKFIQQAISPEVSSISDQYAAATRSADQLPAGGYRSTEMASLPFAQSRDVSNIYSQFAQLVPQSAQQISGIGNLISQTGLSSAQLGLGEQGTGVQQLVNALQGILSKSGLNTQENMANLANLTSGLQTVFSGLV